MFETPDDLFRATTPNAVQAMTDSELDGAYNAAHSFLRHTDEGVLRQVDERFKAIALEWGRRRARLPLLLSTFAVIASLGSLALGLTNRISPPQHNHTASEQPIQAPLPSALPPPNAP